MADSKISALTAASAAAAANEFAINEAGTSKKLTAAQLTTLVLSAPLFAAGSASAASAPRLQTGALNTTPEAGALEYRTNTPYFTPSASNRGVLLCGHLTTVDSDLTGVNGTAVQSIFPAAQDRLTVIAATTYLFDLYFAITCGSTSAGILLAFDAGTCTYTSIRYWAIGATVLADGVTGSTQFACTVGTAAVTLVASAQAATGKWVWARGMMRINAGGTMVPQFAFSADPTGTILIKKDSFMLLTPVGSDTVASVGNWS